MYGDSLNKSHYEQKHDVTEKGQRKTSFGWVNKCISQEKQISGELSILFFNLRRNRGSGKLVEGGRSSLYQPELYVEMGRLWKISEKTSNLRPAITSLYRKTREARITQTPFMEGDPSARKRIF